VADLRQVPSQELHPPVPSGVHRRPWVALHVVHFQGHLQQGDHRHHRQRINFRQGKRLLLPAQLHFQEQPVARSQEQPLAHSGQVLHQWATMALHQLVAPVDTAVVRRQWFPACQVHTCRGRIPKSMHTWLRSLRR